MDLKPVIVFDQDVAYKTLQEIAAQIDQPVLETDLHLNGTQVVYTQGQKGLTLNVDSTLAILQTQLSTFKDGEVPLVIEDRFPAVLDASALADTLRKALSAPLTLTLPQAQTGDPGPWTLDPSTLAGMIRLDRVQKDSGWEYQVTLDAQILEAFLGKISPTLDSAANNARFYFDDTTRQLVLVQPATVWRSLNINTSIAAMQAGLLAGEHAIPLTVDALQPQVGNDATAASLGIKELVYRPVTTYFWGSGSARLQNIDTASQKFYGLLIPPNSTFSMGQAIGDISLDKNYAEALIIYNGRTITGLGGGVCQVSTTLFRMAFFAGYPIVERYAHAYRVFYYEQTATGGHDSQLAGLDATVYFPLVDLKFTNDRPYWLLMETYFSRKNMSLTWKFYSTDDGRTVQWQNQGLTNVIPAPSPLIQENPDLPAGTCKQVDYSGDGADITVTRKVSNAAGQVLINDAFQTQYEPWQAVYQYGPGTQNPQELVAQGLCH